MKFWKLSLVIFACLQVTLSSKSWKKLRAIKRHEGFRVSCCYIDIFCSEVCIEKGERPTYKRSIPGRTSQVQRRKTQDEIRENSRKLLNLMQNANEFRRVWKKWYVLLIFILLIKLVWFHFRLKFFSFLNCLNFDLMCKVLKFIYKNQKKMLSKLNK